MKLFYTMYIKISIFFVKNKLSVFADIILLIASGYLMIKKAFNFSISKWLLDNALQPSAIHVYVYGSSIVLILAICIKSLSLVFEKFPVAKHSTVEPEEISGCLQVMNNEIMNHIKKCDSGELPNIRKIRQQHSFDINIRLVVDSLAEHIRKSIDSIKIKKKDLFVSIYTYDQTKDTLNYELHYDPRRDLVKSKEIDLSNIAFNSYECVKCMKSANSTAYVYNKNDYAKGSSKRHKTLCQYMGCKLESNGKVYGFLNIEFHNHAVFVDEDEMQDFMEENIFPFKLLLEYQYLKGDFFCRFEKLDKHWEVT